MLSPINVQGRRRVLLLAVWWSSVVSCCPASWWCCNTDVVPMWETCPGSSHHTANGMQANIVDHFQKTWTDGEVLDHLQKVSLCVCVWSQNTSKYSGLLYVKTVLNKHFFIIFGPTKDERTTCRLSPSNSQSHCNTVYTKTNYFQIVKMRENKEHWLDQNAEI